MVFRRILTLLRHSLVPLPSHFVWWWHINTRSCPYCLCSWCIASVYQYCSRVSTYVAVADFDICGRQALCGGIEYRNDFQYSFQCFSEAGREPLDRTVFDRIKQLQHLVSEFIITSITLDGTGNGVDRDVLNVFKQSDVESVITLCGGITPESFTHLESFSSRLPQLTESQCLLTHCVLHDVFT